jgi:hypothetical protein
MRATWQKEAEVHDREDLRQPAALVPGEFPFPRGLLRLADGRLVTGIQSPAALAIVDLDAERIDDRIPLVGDAGESPYAIAALPGAFSVLQRFDG